MITVPGLFMVPVIVISPSSALTWVTTPSMGETSVVFRSSSRALSRLEPACATCSFRLLRVISPVRTSRRLLSRVS
jgi:hypothetical protein